MKIKLWPRRRQCTCGPDGACSECVPRLCEHSHEHHILHGCPEMGMPPMTEDKTAAMLGVVPTKAEHIASLTSMLKEFYWQGMTDHGSQALAMELYARGARAPQGHSHP